ncbi:hypothetical protein [Saccharopolyspora sp. CA-218241]|uniref:hypothetical protein n=1 Tax=Saccharopolyspora sp. CA-218241 TaxID=3240027 RepID=UPI003D986B87
MPIRTHRGRAAVYRRLWGWPLRSPKHLAGAVVVLAVLVLAIGFLLPDPPPSPDPTAGQRTASQQAAQQRNQAAAEAAERTGSPPSISVPTEPPPPAAPDPAAVALVESWGAAWVNHPPGSTKQQWLDGLRPFTTPEFLAVMESVDPANAGNAVTGPATAGTTTATSMRVHLPTDVGELSVRVVRTPDGWRVTEYDKEG